ncbi:hypothetical protein GCM10023339_03810 [Alloalcanivorax gelatiniphagus]
MAVGSAAESLPLVDPVLQPVRAATRRVAAVRGVARVRFIKTPVCGGDGRADLGQPNHTSPELDNDAVR